MTLLLDEVSERPVAPADTLSPLTDLSSVAFVQGKDIDAGDWNQEEASRVRQEVGMVPELWGYISTSCIEDKAMQCNAMQCGKDELPMVKAPEATVAFSSYVDLAVIRRILAYMC